jgi:hypothetical protein
MAWDDFLSDIKDVTQSETFQDINSYLKANPSTLQLVGIGQPQAGNQTAAQIAAGQAGGPKPTAAPASASTPGAAAALNNAMGSGLFKNGKFLGLSAGAIVVIGLGAFFLLSKKGK